MGEKIPLHNAEGAREKCPVVTGAIGVVGAISLSVSSCLAATCEKTTFPNLAQIHFSDLKRNPEYTHVWGRENMKITQE